MSLRSIKKIVIHNIVVRGTLDGAMPRNHIYKKETTTTQRKAFREYLARELERLLQDILRKKTIPISTTTVPLPVFQARCPGTKRFETTSKVAG